MTESPVKNPKLRFLEFDENWRKMRINQLTERVSIPVEVEATESYTQIGVRSHGKGLFHKEPIVGKELGNKRVFWVKENLFIVNIVFAWEQAVAKTTKDELGTIASHRFPMLRPKADLLNLDFLLLSFLTRRGKSLLELASPGGAGRNKTLGQREFDRTKINLPCVEEQKKIAAFLLALNEKIGQLARKKGLLHKYKKGVMQQIFDQTIRFKDDEGNDFPDWEESTLGDLGSTYNGLVGKTADDFGEGSPYITYKQIFDNSRIQCGRFGFVRIDPKEKQNQVKFGDVFFTTSSETPGEIAFASVILDKVEDLYLNSFCFGYRAHSLNTVKPQFSRYLFRSYGFRRKVFRLAQGSTRYNISKTEMMKLSIALPGPAEQVKIAAFLSAIDEKIEYLDREMGNTKLFKKGLLQQMFV